MIVRNRPNFSVLSVRMEKVIIFRGVTVTAEAHLVELSPLSSSSCPEEASLSLMVACLSEQEHGLP